MILHIDVDRARWPDAGEGGPWVVAAHRSGTRALVTKFSARKVSVRDINGDKVSYSWFDLPPPLGTPDPGFVSGAPPTAAAGSRGSVAVLRLITAKQKPNCKPLGCRPWLTLRDFFSRQRFISMRQWGNRSQAQGG